MSSIFEKTMRACLEDKKISSKSSLNESKKFNEDYEADPDDFEGVEGFEPEDTEMDGISDDVMVIIDPDMDEKEFNSAAEKAQEMIDGSDEPIVDSDEFIGDYTYTCPICGNTFFSEVEMHDGDECPVCGDTPDGYVFVGQIAEAETDADDNKDEETEEDDTADDNANDTESEEVEDTEDDLEPAEAEENETEEVEESCKNGNCKDGKRDDNECKDGECKKESRRTHPRMKRESKKPLRRRSSKRMSENKAVPSKKTSRNFKLDEKTFNPFLNKFIHENYKNAKSFEVKSASRCGSSLKFECVITFNSGKSQKVVLKAEKFDPKSNVLSMRDDGAFKCESTNNRTAPFVFKINVSNNIIRCEGLRYNFITKSMTEGKKLQICGNLARKPQMESKRNFRRGMRK